MTFLQAILLGLLQGLTEFLPVSSSGHLAILQKIWGLKEMLAFDVILHVATLFAVILYLRREVWALVRGFFVLCVSVLPAKRPQPDSPAWQDRRLFLLVFVASIPTAAVALSLKPVIHWAETDMVAVGVFLIITGILLFLTRTVREGGRPLTGMRFLDAILIGIAQGIAALPGISRSGSTISTGVVLGLESRAAARFSFLIFLPAIAGATLLEGRKVIGGEVGPLGPIIAGAAAAFLSGLVAVAIVFRLLEKRCFAWFAPYCWLVGIAAVVYGITQAF